MRRFIIVLLAVSFGVVNTINTSQAQSSLEDIFRKSIDDILGKKDNGSDKEETKIVPRSMSEVKMSFSPIVKKTKVSVVNVYAAKKVRQSLSPFESDDFFGQLFGRNGPFRAPKPRVQSSLGSGVIVASDGVILTNNHVISGADEVKIALYDGSEYEAEIILKDEKSDLAVLRVKEDVEFEAIEIADSEAVEVGDLVLAIGNPFGVGQTVTSGIVSAVARSRVGVNDFDFFIQTDAAINPGNSGGALVDMNGRLVGINTAIFSRSGGSNGIGFAIPSNMAQVIIRSAQSGEAMVTRPWIGADFQEVTSEIAESLGMRRPGGVLVASVFEGGPADKAGLKPGDVVIGINQKILQNNDALSYRLDTIGVGGEAELVVISGKERKVVNLRLIEAPELTPREDTRIDARAVLGGALVANMSPAVAQEVGVSASTEGVIVLDVPRRTRAYANGVKKGDLVLAINGVEVKNVEDVVRITSRESRRGWQVVMERGGRKFVFERNGSFFRQYRP